HRVRPARALTFAVGIEAAGVLWLALTVNVLSAALALSAALFYVFVYTVWLKRRSPQNIVIGGAAGAVPVLVGWAAVTGRVGWPAAVLFVLIFLWTPPHFWALSMRYERDYAAAGVPMLPVVAGRDATTRQIVRYAWLVVATSLVLIPVGHLGWLYSVSAVGLGSVFVARALALRRKGTVGSAMTLFRYSNIYLASLWYGSGTARAGRSRRRSTGTSGSSWPGRSPRPCSSPASRSRPSGRSSPWPASPRTPSRSP